MKKSYILLRCLLLVKFLLCERIKINEPEPDDYKAKCESGILQKYVDIKSEVQLNDSRALNLTDYYVILEPTSYTENLRNCLQKRDTTNIWICNYTMLITNASKFTVDAFLSSNLNMIKNDRKVLQNLREIFKATGNLTINKKPIDTDNCLSNLISNKLALHFKCSSLAKPCVIEIKANDSNIASYYNDSALFKRDLKDQTILNISIKFSTCSFQGRDDGINCLVTVVNSDNGVGKRSTQENVFKAAYDGLLGIIIIIGSVIGVALSIGLYYFRKRKRKNRECNRRNLGDTIESDPQERRRLNDPIVNDGSPESNELDFDQEERMKLIYSDIYPMMLNGYQNTKSIFHNNNVMLKDAPSMQKIIASYAYQCSSDFQHEDAPSMQKIIASYAYQCSSDFQHEDHMRTEKLLSEIDCNENNEHKNYIPYKTFCLNDLRDWCSDMAVFKFIKAIAELTVMLTVRENSENRNSYPDYRITNRQSRRHGTGMILHAVKYNPEDGKCCQCCDCRSSGSEKTTFLRMLICTVSKIVFDEKEANSTSFTFFYDESKSREVASYCCRFIESDLNKGYCLLVCDIHNPDNIRRVKEVYHEYSLKKESVSKMMFNTNLVVLVSHPHGSHKHVSLGSLIKVIDHRDGITSLVYDIDTCSGRIGAYVYVLGTDVDLLVGKHFHKGLNKEGKNASTLSCIADAIYLK